MILIRECFICHRALNQLDDPFSVDCGGNCVVCMADAGDPECVQSVIEIAGQIKPPHSRFHLSGNQIGPKIIKDDGPSYSSRSIDGDVRPL